MLGDPRLSPPPTMAKPTHPNAEPFPKGTSGPALRALHGAGIRRVDELATWRRAELAALHGMGPKVIGLLESARHERALHFRGDS